MVDGERDRLGTFRFGGLQLLREKTVRQSAGAALCTSTGIGDDRAAWAGSDDAARWRNDRPGPSGFSDSSSELPGGAATGHQWHALLPAVSGRDPAAGAGQRVAAGRQ